MTKPGAAGGAPCGVSASTALTLLAVAAVAAVAYNAGSSSATSTASSLRVRNDDGADLAAPRAPVVSAEEEQPLLDEEAEAAADEEGEHDDDGEQQQATRDELPTDATPDAGAAQSGVAPAKVSPSAASTVAAAAAAAAAVEAPPLPPPPPASPAAVPAAASPPPPPPHLACSAVVARLRDTLPGTTWPPPCPLEDTTLADAFSRHGMPIARYWCLADRYEGVATLRWEHDDIEAKRVAILPGGTWCGSYDCAERDNVQRALAAHADEVVGKRGLVLGSEYPWIEILALNLGASEVWTMEYATIVSTHPQLVTRTNKELAVSFLDGTLPQFDFVVSFSSIEHSGLGRYGDALNPEGDAEALRQAHCFLKPGGLMLLGAPMSCVEQGRIDFNAHRVFGNERLRFITAGFEMLPWENGGCEAVNAASQQPILGLRKRSAHPAAPQ